MLKYTKKLCYLSLLCSISIILGYIETLLPAFIGIPGCKIGLANIVILTILLCYGFKEAFVVSILRVFIIAIVFSNMYTFIYSLTGALLSLVMMYIFKQTHLFSNVIISIIGGISHNIGQLLVATFFFSSTVFVYYLPYLLLFGIVSGIGIGVISQITYIKLKDIIGM